MKEKSMIDERGSERGIMSSITLEKIKKQEPDTDINYRNSYIDHLEISEVPVLQ